MSCDFCVEHGAICKQQFHWKWTGSFGRTRPFKLVNQDLILGKQGPAVANLIPWQMHITPVVFNSHFANLIWHCCFLCRLFLADELLFDFAGVFIVKPTYETSIVGRGLSHVLEWPAASLEPAGPTCLYRLDWTHPKLPAHIKELWHPCFLCLSEDLSELSTPFDAIFFCLCMCQLSISRNTVNGFVLLTNKTFLLADKTVRLQTHFRTGGHKLQHILTLPEYFARLGTFSVFDPVRPLVFLIKYVGQLFFFKQVIIRR